MSIPVPGWAAAFSDDAGTPESPASAAWLAGRHPGSPPASADILARGILDAWREDLDELLATLSPDERTSRLGRLERARAAYVAAQAPEAMRPAQVAHHAAFAEHEYTVAASFAEARTSEPGLTCTEWARRNPFNPATAPVPARG